MKISWYRRTDVTKQIVAFRNLANATLSFVMSEGSCSVCGTGKKCTISFGRKL